MMDKNSSAQPRVPQSGGYYGNLMTKAEFYHHKTHRKQLTNLNLCCTIFYFIVLMSFVMMNKVGNVLTGLLGVTGSNSLITNVWIDYVLVILLTLGIQFLKSRVCAFTLFLYTGADCLFKYFNYHKIEGVWPLLVAGYLVTITFELYSAWKQYQKTGIA